MHHLSETEIQEYQANKISPDQLLELDDHIKSCELCRNRLDEKSDKAAFQWLRTELNSTALENTGHVSYEQMESFVDGRLDSVDLENVQSHLEICNLCKAEEQELRSVQSEIQARLNSGKFAGFWPTALKVAGVAAAIAFFIWASTIPMRNEIKDLRAQLIEEQNNSAKLLLENKELKDKYAGVIQSNNPQVVITLNDGDSKIELDKNGNVKGLPELPASYQQKIAMVLTKQEVQIPSSLKDIIGKQEILLSNQGNSKLFALSSPVGTVVSSDRPSFSWESLAGAESYRVYIYDDHYNEIASSPSLKETNWTTSKALSPGMDYAWQVVATKAGKEFLSPAPPSPQAKFQVLSEDKRKELQPLLQASNNSHLVMGTLYAEFGLLDDAEREFSTLSKENAQSEVAKKILDSIQLARHAAPKN